MRILHVISQAPDFTGSGKFIREIIRQSRQSGHDNFLLAAVQGDFHFPAALVEKSRCLFVRCGGGDLDFPIPGMSDIMPYNSSVFSTLTPCQLAAYRAAFQEKIEAAVERFRPDILHTHHLWMVSAVCRKIVPLEIPMVTTCHGTCLRQHRLCPEISRSIRGEIRDIDRVIALSRAQKNIIRDVLGFESDKIIVISGGYNNTCFFSEKKEFSGRVEILYAGKISDAKGVPWLIKSLGRIRHLPFRLHLAGNAGHGQKEHCLALARNLGEKAVYHGALSHEKLGELMRRAHIFVLPSFYEGLPLVLTEALACGCRIITTALPGVREIFKTPHPDMIRMVELPPLETIDTPFQKDEEMLAQKLSGVLTNAIFSVMEEPRPDMAYVQSTVAGFTWEKIFLKMESVYTALV